MIMTFRNMQGVTETYQYKGYNIDVNYISDASYWERLDNSLMVESNAYSNIAEISLIGENKYIDFNTGVSIHTPTQGVTLYLITYYKSANLIHCYANHHYYSTS